MPQGKKTDNQNLWPKIELRRYFLNRYHKRGAIRVLDCCQGNGVIWSILRDEFELDSYWGVDVKKKRGRLTIKSERILSQPGWLENVIDVDTYGSPWKHWEGIIRNLIGPTTVFLTIGSVTAGRGGGAGTMLPREARRAIGFATLPVPPSLQARIWELSIPYCLDLANKNNVEIMEAREGIPHPAKVRYIGVRIRPKKS